MLKSRLRRVELASRSSLGPLSCPTCGLRAQDRSYIVVDGKDPAPAVPEVCPECGRSTRIHIVVVEEAELGGGGGT